MLEQEPGCSRASCCSEAVGSAGPGTGQHHGRRPLGQTQPQPRGYPWLGGAGMLLPTHRQALSQDVTSRRDQTHTGHPSPAGAPGPQAPTYVDGARSTPWAETLGAVGPAAPASPNLPRLQPAPAGWSCPSSAQLHAIIPSRDGAGKAAGGEDQRLAWRGAWPEIAPAPRPPGQGTFLRRPPHPPRRGITAWSLGHVRRE